MEVLETLIGSINVEHAQASESEDLEKILSIVQKIGVTHMNNIVMLQLKEWLVATIE